MGWPAWSTIQPESQPQQNVSHAWSHNIPHSGSPMAGFQSGPNEPVGCPALLGQGCWSHAVPPGGGQAATSHACVRAQAVLPCLATCEQPCTRLLVQWISRPC